MRLRDDVTIDAAILDLNRVTTGLENVESDNRHYDVPTGRYLNWVAEAEPLLRNFLVEPNPSAILHTERYWRMIDYTAPSLVHPLIRNEVAVQKARLAKVRSQLERYRQRANRQGRLVVADTNVYLHFQWRSVGKWATTRLDADNQRLRWVLPLVILDELDSKKYTSRARQMSDRARSVLKTLEPLIAHAISAGGTTEVEPGMNLEVLDEDERHERMSNTDSEILDQAAFLQQITQSPVTIITNDTNMMTRALLRGLAAERPLEKYRLPPPADGTPEA